MSLFSVYLHQSISVESQTAQSLLVSIIGGASFVACKSYWWSFISLYATYKRESLPLSWLRVCMVVQVLLAVGIVVSSSRAVC